MQQADSSDPYIDPFNVHEEIRAGDSLLYILNFQNGVGPLDVTGYIFLFTVKRSRDDDDSLALAQTRYTCLPGSVSQSGVVSFEALTRFQSGNIPSNQTYVIDI